MKRRLWLIAVLLLQLLTLSAQQVPSPSRQSIELILQKDSLKILDIGNSYTDDATALLPLIVSESGTDVRRMCMYKAVRGGASFKNWVDIYNDQDNNTYSFKKLLGGISANVESGSGAAYDGSLMRRVLTDEQWDLIIIHQYSVHATDYASWTGNGAQGYLNEFLDLIKQHQAQAAIGFLLIHSYWGDYLGNLELSSYRRWQKISEATQRLAENYDVSIVIPYGTAVQNLRQSRLNNDYDLTRDGTHLDLGLARYAAACCYYQTVFYPRSSITVMGNPARYDVSGHTSSFPSVSVDDTNAIFAQRAAILATMQPYTCISPESYVEGLCDDIDGDGQLTISDITFLLDLYLKSR